MEIKILATYFHRKEKNGAYCGSATVGLLCFELRGILFSLINGKVKKVFIPYRYGINDDGVVVQYPWFTFADREQNRGFIKELKRVLQKHVEDNGLTNEKNIEIRKQPNLKGK